MRLPPNFQHYDAGVLFCVWAVNRFTGKREQIVGPVTREKLEKMGTIGHRDRWRNPRIRIWKNETQKP